MLKNTLKMLGGIKPGQYVTDDVECYDEAEILELGRVLNRLLYSPSKLRKLLQQCGVTITRSDFYSELPLLSDIENSFRNSTNLYLDRVFPDNAFLAGYLTDLTQFSAEFDPPATSSRPDEYSWSHGPFAYSDAMAYYSMIRKIKPATVIELGSGTSTLVAMKALERNGGGRLIAIEPFPKDFLKTLRGVELMQIPAQRLELSFLENTLGDGDILFIDTTHTVRHNSDCLHIYLRVLPWITKNITVHVHDVYLPKTLPLPMMRDQQLFWNEQYLLYAYMLRNPTTKILYGSQYHNQKNPELLKAFMHGRHSPGGASIWFSQAGR